MNFWVAIYRFCWIAFAVLFVVAVACMFAPRTSGLREMQRKRSQYSEEIRRKEAELAEFKEKQKRFQTDPAFVEKTAREIGMVKTNELVFKFTSNQPTSRVEAPRR